MQGQWDETFLKYKSFNTDLFSDILLWVYIKYSYFP
jgi:hypothetical protein